MMVVRSAHYAEAAVGQSICNLVTEACVLPAHCQQTCSEGIGPVQCVIARWVPTKQPHDVAYTKAYSAVGDSSVQSFALDYGEC